MPFYTFECPKCKGQKEELQPMGKVEEPTCENVVTYYHEGGFI